MPMSPKRTPTKIIPTALMRDPLANTTAPVRPRIMRLKYSRAPKANATCVRGSAKAAISIVEKHPAMKLPKAAMPSAAPARPCRAKRWPSKHVTTAEASPGMLTRMAAVEPPYCAP